MKAETLKPFITSPSVTEYVGNRKRNVIVIGLSIFIFIIIASLFGFTIWNSIRVAQLQKRIESLNKFVDNMHKRLGLDYLDELNEFENNYANHDDLIDDPDNEEDDDDDENSEEDGQLLSRFDAQDYDDDDHTADGKNHRGRQSKNSQEDNDLESGSGNYDDDDDDEEDDDDDDVYDEDDSHRGRGRSHIKEDNGDKLFDDYEKFVGSKKRKTRSASELEDGKINKGNKNLDKSDEINDGTEKIDDEIKLTLILSKEDDITTPQSEMENSKSVLMKAQHTEGKKVKSHEHQNENSNRLIVKLEEQPQVNHENKVSSAAAKDKHHPKHPDHDSKEFKDYVLYPYTPNELNKLQSSVGERNDMHKQPGSVAHRRKITKIKSGEDMFVNRHRYRNGKMYSHNQERKNSNIIAAHFNLNRVHVVEPSNAENDALLNHQRDFENSIYIPTISSWSSKNQPLSTTPAHHANHQHKQKQQNHHQHRPDEKAAATHNKISDDDQSSVTQHQPTQVPTVQNGIVTVQVSGIYYIYAQIFYHNHKDRNGYWIYHNAKPFLQCYTTIPNDSVEKGNTCYTSGVLYLVKGDTIHLKDMYKDHNAIFGTSKSFFGLVRLGDAEHNHYSR